MRCICIIRGSTLSRHGGGGGGVGKHSAAYEDLSSLALSPAGEGASFTSI